MPGSTFVRSIYDETRDPIRIWQMTKNCIPKCAGPNESFGLEKTCQFETHRRSFLADGRFTVVLDETDFGHSAGEVELLAEDEKRAHADIDVFLARYAWLFDCSTPKGKLTAYFEKNPHNEVWTYGMELSSTSLQKIPVFRIFMRRVMSWFSACQYTDRPCWRSCHLLLRK